MTAIALMPCGNPLPINEDHGASFLQFHPQQPQLQHEQHRHRHSNMKVKSEDPSAAPGNSWVSFAAGFKREQLVQAHDDCGCDSREESTHNESKAAPHDAPKRSPQPTQKRETADDKPDARTMIETMNQLPRRIRKKFPYKLFRLLLFVEQRNQQDIVWWTQDEDGIVVHDKERFEQEIMPHFFDSSMIRSFDRQFSNWQFRRIAKKRTSFCHASFRRYRIDLLQHIKRTKDKSCKPRRFPIIAAKENVARNFAEVPAAGARLFQPRAVLQPHDGSGASVGAADAAGCIAASMPMSIYTAQPQATQYQPIAPAPVAPASVFSPTARPFMLRSASQRVSSADVFGERDQFGFDDYDPLDVKMEADSDAIKPLQERDEQPPSPPMHVAGSSTMMQEYVTGDDDDGIYAYV